MLSRNPDAVDHCEGFCRKRGVFFRDGLHLIVLGAARLSRAIGNIKALTTKNERNVESFD